MCLFKVMVLDPKIPSRLMLFSGDIFTQLLGSSLHRLRGCLSSQQVLVNLVACVGFFHNLCSMIFRKFHLNFLVSYLGLVINHLLTLVGVGFDFFFFSQCAGLYNPGVFLSIIKGDSRFSVDSHGLSCLYAAIFKFPLSFWTQMVFHVTADLPH